MNIKLPEKYTPDRWERGGQTETYLLPVDKGSVDSLKAISVRIRDKGINAVHPRKEMETPKTDNYDLMIKDGYITSNMVGNLSKLRFHGLIARVEAGNYCMTTKGARFLKAETTIPK